MIFVDTNYFLRYLRDDVPVQSEKVKELFKQAVLKRDKLVTTVTVIFEIYWVLGSFYNYNKGDIGKGLISILKLRNLEITEREIIYEAIAIYMKTNFDLEDAYVLAYCQENGVTTLKTFDKKLEKAFNRKN
jgi:predicted nucleic-acid-binding protein